MRIRIRFNKAERAAGKAAARGAQAAGKAALGVTGAAGKAAIRLVAFGATTTWMVAKEGADKARARRQAAKAPKAAE